MCSNHLKLQWSVRLTNVSGWACQLHHSVVSHQMSGLHYNIQDDAHAPAGCISRARCSCVLSCTLPHSVMLIFSSLCHSVTSSCLKMTSLVGPIG